MGGNSGWSHPSQSRFVQADPQRAGEAASDGADITGSELARLSHFTNYIRFHAAGLGRVSICF